VRNTEPYTLRHIFGGSWLAASDLSHLQLTLRDPAKLGARFFWQEVPPDTELREGEAADLLPGERWLFVEWTGEPPRPMSHAEEMKILRRVHTLGFKQVTLKRLWGVLAPTLPHNGYGSRARR